MNHTDLIKRLRDALQQASDCLSLEVILQGRDPDLAEWHAAIAEADAYLASGGWVRVKDALPVVPEGEHAVAIAIFNGADVVRTYWQAQKTSFFGNYSHWRLDPLPQPPEQTK